ncbi:MAG: hypothetical protein U0R44_06080 [Candidatus Micrarchaeia archaeon]
MTDARRLRMGTEDGNNHKTPARANPFRRYMLAAAFAAGMGALGPSCGSNGPDDVVHIPPLSDGGTVSDGGNTDGGCTNAPAPLCSVQSLTALLRVGDAPLVVGDYRVRLANTDESGGEQRAQVEVLNSCGAVLSSQTINENGDKRFIIDGTDIEIDVTVTNITVTDPKSARFTVSMVCRTDGGVTDGGLTDSGSGGDGGSGGMDSGTGGDGGAATDGGVSDGGAGGMDGGVSDGGAPVDGGVSDGGAPVDGGVSDGGAPVDGGVSDGGMDGGAVDAGDGGPATVCPGVFNSSRGGMWPVGVDEPMGGYNIRYTGPSGFNPVFDIRCAANGNPVRLGNVAIIFTPTAVNIPEDYKTVQFSIGAANMAWASGTISSVTYP